MVTDDINNGSGVQIIINGVPQGGSGGGLSESQVNALIAAGARYDGAQLSVPLLVDPDSQGFGPGVLTGAQNQITEFTLTGSPNGGTFIPQGLNGLGVINWNDDEAAIQLAFDDGGTGLYLVTGGLDAGPGPVRVEGIGANANTPITFSLTDNSLTVDGDPGGDVSFNEIQAGSAGVLAPPDWSIDGDGTIEIGTDSGAFGLTDEAGLVERLRGGSSVTNTLIFHAGSSSTFTLVPSTVIPLTEGNLYRAWASVASAGDGNSLAFGDSAISDYETVTLPNTGMGGRALVSILFTAGNDYANAGVRLLNTTDVHIFYLAIEEIVTRVPMVGLDAVYKDQHLHLEDDGLYLNTNKVEAGSVAYSDLTGVPSTFAPSAHAASHQNSGGDEVATATAGANAIPKADAGGTLDKGWIPNQLSATAVGGALPTGPTLAIPVAPTASTDYGVLSIGGGGFAGGGAPNFVGNAAGTHIAINASAGFAGRMLDARVAGVRQFAVGLGTVASATSAVLNGIDIAPYTYVITGNTAITTAAGFNAVTFGIPTYSAASAVAITVGATVAIAGPPAVAASATLTTALAFDVQSGTARFQGDVFHTANATWGSGVTVDNTLQRLAAHSMQWGAANNASPLGYTMTFGESGRGGTDTDKAGGSATIQSGLGTGAGTVSNIVFRTPTVAASGTTAQAYATRLTIDSAAATFVPVIRVADGSVTTPGYAFGSGTSTGFYQVSGGVVSFASSGTRILTLSGSGYNMSRSYAIGFTDTGFTVLDASITSPAAASIQIGKAASATPVANTLTIGESSRGATDNNVAGANGTLQSGLGTGIGAVTSLALRTSLVAASGTTAQTYQTILSLSTAGAVVQPSIATPAAGAVGACLLFGTTAAFGIYYGSGAPTVAAAQGSFYLRSDGDATHRAYIATDGSGTWTPLVSVG